MEIAKTTFEIDADEHGNRGLEHKPYRGKAWLSQAKQWRGEATFLRLIPNMVDAPIVNQSSCIIYVYSRMATRRQARLLWVVFDIFWDNFCRGGI